MPETAAPERPRTGAEKTDAPTGWTARHAEDFPQESWNLARTRTNRRVQAPHAWRQLPSVLPFGMVLKAPQGPGRVP